MHICIDGRLARMSGGTGVAVYGAALAETVGLLGHVVEELVEGRRNTRFNAWRGALRPGAWPVPLVDGPAWAVVFSDQRKSASICAVRCCRFAIGLIRHRLCTGPIRCRSDSRACRTSTRSMISSRSSTRG